MDSSKVTDKCISCGGTAFRSDRPYGNFCSMMCALRGVLTPAEKKKEDERFKVFLENSNKNLENSNKNLEN